MLIRSTLLIGVTSFWLTMMSMLIGREFFELTPIQTAYEVLPLTTGQLRREDQGIYLGNRRIGLSFSRLEADPEKETAFELHVHTYMSFFLLGERVEMLVKGKAKLDESFYLKRFAIKITSQDYWTELQGEVLDHTINLVVEEKDTAADRRLIPIKGPILFSESLDYLWTPENLKTGKRGRLQIFNPMVANPEDIEFRVGEKETMNYRGETKEVYRVYLKKGEIETTSWVTPEGITLQKESYTGLLFVKEPAWELYEAMRNEMSSPPDLPNLFSIPTNQILGDLENLSYLKAVLKSQDKEEIVEITRRPLSEVKDLPWPVKTEDPSFDVYLNPSVFIQSDDGEIKAKAREIVGEETTALGASLKIMKWVHKNMNPLPTVGIPSAKQILTTLKGDCNEYTALFTALTRSLGIPTKMIAGLVYRDGRFFYHAWPEVYTGQWVSLDPTFNQAPSDVGHIPLLDGDLKEQINLVSRLGQTKVLILETKKDSEKKL
ncbi:MAG: transglutaminase domain-containing protein [Candidatus Omnitrophica bacterium]|nr:transglutaminase domain-containing protein [Candidatus Omnitrophota bacterium]